MKTILFDLDGTLANLDHRVHHFYRKEHYQFYNKVDQDSPIQEMIDLCNILYNYYYILIVSGRSDICKDKTKEWLRDNQVFYHDIFMRKEGDQRKDHKVKQDLLSEILEQNYNPIMAFDDRKSIADVWRKNGIRALLCDDWEENNLGMRIGNPNLYVMIGPTGVGKTTWIHNNLSCVYRISSDEMRYYLTGDFKDQNRNDDVFKVCHELMKTILWKGGNVVFDATNIKNQDRRKILENTPENTNIYYVVLNRSEESVKETRDWRPDWLIEKHQNTFRSNLNDILNGDGKSFVTILDCREE